MSASGFETHIFGTVKVFPYKQPVVKHDIGVLRPVLGDRNRSRIDIHIVPVLFAGGDMSMAVE